MAVRGTPHGWLMSGRERAVAGAEGGSATFLLVCGRGGGVWGVRANDRQGEAFLPSLSPSQLWSVFSCCCSSRWTAAASLPLPLLLSLCPVLSSQPLHNGHHGFLGGSHSLAPSFRPKSCNPADMASNNGSISAPSFLSKDFCFFSIISSIMTRKTCNTVM